MCFAAVRRARFAAGTLGMFLGKSAAGHAGGKSFGRRGTPCLCQIHAHRTRKNSVSLRLRGS
jgi:hypothetical protein